MTDSIVDKIIIVALVTMICAYCELMKSTCASFDKSFVLHGDKLVLSVLTASVVLRLFLTF